MLQSSEKVMVTFAYKHWRNKQTIYQWWQGYGLHEKMAGIKISVERLLVPELWKSLPSKSKIKEHSIY